MTIRDRAEAAYQVILPVERREEISGMYGQAASALYLEELESWLMDQPAGRIVGQPQMALGCLLATFLADVTGQMWAVERERFYLFALGPAYGWWLPTWAVGLETLELACAGTLTVGEGIQLVRFIAQHPSLTARHITTWLTAWRAA
jgi:hypothetical protein